MHANTETPEPLSSHRVGSSAEHGSSASSQRAVRVLFHPLTLWAAFLCVHVILGGIAYLTHKGFGDVYNVYRPWSKDALDGWIIGINEPWVYPIAAIVPILLPVVFFGVAHYGLGWLVLVTVVDAFAFAVLLFTRERRRVIAAWWWLGFLLLLGPVALGRIDAISAALAIVGLLWLSTRERTAVILLTFAMWIKVWPAALIASAVIAMQRRWRIVLMVAVVSVVIVTIPLAFGSGWNVVSFVTKQTGRGIQIEAPVATLWMWLAAFKVGGAHVYYDRVLVTFQVAGHGTHIGEALMTPLLALAVVSMMLIGVRAARQHRTSEHILPELSLGLVTAFIAFNKVGSPQYITWFAAPVVLGLVAQGRQFRVPAILVLITAGLTQLFYPYFYGGLMHPNVVMVSVLTMRNLMYFVIMAWSISRLWGPPKNALNLK